MRKIGSVLFATGLIVFSAGCKSSKAPGQPAPAPPAETSMPRVFVTDEVSGELSIIDSGNYNLLANVPLGKRPRGIHASPDNKTLYVAVSGTPIAGPDVDESTLPPADKSADGIAVFDVAQRKVLRVIHGGSDPENFDISKDGSQLYISNEDVSAVSILDVASGNIVKSLSMGAQPEGVKVTPDGKQVWVTSEETSTISVLDPAAGKIIKTFKVGHRPRNIAFFPMVHAHISTRKMTEPWFWWTRRSIGSSRPFRSVSPAW